VLAKRQYGGKNRFDLQADTTCTDLQKQVNALSESLSYPECW